MGNRLRYLREMRIVIAGAHGRIARELGRLLVAAGHDVAGLIRNPDQAADLEADQVAPVVIDLENSTSDDVIQVLTGAEAAVFAAGAGRGGQERYDTVDRGAAVLLADGAEQAGVQRFVQISAMGLDMIRGGVRPDGLNEVRYAYLVAKLAAEEDLMSRSSLDWTILRPGRLTDEPAVGLVELGRGLELGTIPRHDVAAVLAELLRTGRGSGQVLDVVSGTLDIPDAVAALPFSL